MVAYESEENRTRMRMSKMMGWNIFGGRRGRQRESRREKQDKLG
jgi:hypothetical protein